MMALMMYPQVRQALKMEELAQQAQLSVQLIPTPESIHPDCGFSLQVPLAEVAQVQALSKQANCPYRNIYIAKYEGLKLIVQGEYEEKNE